MAGPKIIAGTEGGPVIPGPISNIGSSSGNTGTSGGSTAYSISSSILGLGLELAMLGVATGIASMSDDVGNIMLVFMIGLLLLFMMHHLSFTNAIPNLFAMLPATATS